MGNLKFSYCVLSNNPAGHTIQNVTGYSVDASIAVGESTNIGFASNIGPSAGNWNFYASGSAPNYFRGQVLTHSGTVAAPSVSIYGDEDTGSWSPAADTWAVSTGGVERLRIKSDGKSSFTGDVTVSYAADDTTQTGVVFVDGDFTTAANARNNNFGLTIDARKIVSSGITDTGYLIAVNADCYHEGDGTITEMYGVRCAAGKRVDSTGIVQNAYGVMAQVKDLSNPKAGEITNGYGIYINEVIAANAWGLYQKGNFDNWFEGNVGIGVGKSRPSSALDVYGVITVSRGTQASPAVVFDSDTDTGIFSPAADTWAVSTGGVERLRVTDTGDLLAATGYTPANPQSLATKEYVDNSAPPFGAVTLYQIVTPSEYAALTEYDPHVMYLVTENDQTVPPVDQDNALAYTIVTRAEFDALPTKDEHTIYIIKG